MVKQAHIPKRDPRSDRRPNCTQQEERAPMSTPRVGGAAAVTGGKVLRYLIVRLGRSAAKGFSRSE